MRDDAGTSGDDMERLLQAVEDRAEQLGGSHAELAREWQRRVTDQQREAEESFAKIIQAIRELLSSPMPADSEGHRDTLSINWEQSQSPAGVTSEAHDQKPILRELIDRPDGLTQLQSLQILAAVIRAFSQESGRPETEILEELAANLRQAH